MLAQISALLLSCTMQGAIDPSGATAISGVARSARSIIQIDGFASQWIHSRASCAPGQVVDIPQPLRSKDAGHDAASATWHEVVALADGSFDASAYVGGYLALQFDSPADQVMELEATGHGMVYANGPRMGDPYATGYQRIPVAVTKGKNEFVFSAGRGNIKARLVAPRLAGAHLDSCDVTAPDLIVGESLDSWIGLRVLNASSESATNLALEIEAQDGTTTRTPLATLVPLGIAKAPARLRSGAFGLAGEARFRVALVRADSPEGDARATLDEMTITLQVKPVGATHKETFRSEVDGSAQYFAVVPATTGSAPAGRPGIVLSLHGASVEAEGQARCYQPRDWAHIVAPTNRRPYGFDWEEWGRIDALEVLATARGRLASDPLRQWLTGHSMGGHGTWSVGANHADLFAAIAPSAGWISFFTYVNAPESAANPGDSVGLTLDRAANPSRPLLLRDNYSQVGVYILHGDVDDNVPVTEAREMRAQLGQFHPDFAYHEQVGANHWWGNECVDWPPLMDFLRARSLRAPGEQGHISFTTISPGINSRSGWVVIDQQVVAFEPSKVDLTIDRQGRSVRGTTSNVARLGLDVDLDGDGGELTIAIDTTTITTSEPDGGDLIWMARSSPAGGGDAHWELCDPPAMGEKSARQMGPFKSAFGNRAVLVYGTTGSAQQTAALLTKARFDNEQFAYRGNASFDIVDDRTFLAQADSTYSNRNVVIYGNSQTNGAWDALLADSPIKVGSGSIEVRAGDASRRYVGEDLGAIFVRPRAMTDRCLVGVVAGTGAPGQALLERSPYFMAGSGYPDATVFRADMLENGRDGIIGAAFFANDWTLRAADVLSWPISQ